MRAPIHVYAFVFLTGISVGWIARPLPNRTTDLGARHQAGKATAEAARKAQPIMGAKTAMRNLASGGIADFVKRHIQNGKISGGGMAAAIEEMSKTNDPLLRREIFTTLLDHLNTENAPGAYEALVRHSRGRAGQNQEILLLANTWGRLAPIEALNAISKVLRGNDTWPEGNVWDTPDMAEVLAGWAMTAPEEASRFLEGTTGKKELLTNGLMRGLIARGTDQAMAYILKTPATEENLAARQTHMGMVTGDVLKQRGFESATNWLDGITDKSLKSSGFTQIAEDTKFLRDGTAGSARDWVARHATDEAAKDAICVLAKQYAQNSPGNAMKWADKNFPENIREIIYKDALGIWAHRNAHNASNFLDALPSSRARDSAVGEFSKVIADDEPVSAIKWAQTIEDEAKRSEALTSIAATWLKSDYGSAVDWLAGNAFTNLNKQ